MSTMGPRKGVRIIINVDEGMEDRFAVSHALRVIQSGKISEDGKSYCYVTTFKDGVLVSAKRTKSGHSFWINKP